MTVYYVVHRKIIHLSIKIDIGNPLMYQLSDLLFLSVQYIFLGEVFSLNNALCMALFLVMYDFCLEEDTEKKLKVCKRILYKLIVILAINIFNIISCLCRYIFIVVFFFEIYFLFLRILGLSCFNLDCFQLTYVLAILSGFAMTNQHTSSMFVMALICFVLSDLFDHGVRLKLDFYLALVLFSRILHHKNLDIVQ